MCLYIYVWILLHKPTRHRQFLDWFLTNTVFKKKHKLYIFSATEPRKSSPNKNVCFTRLLSGMEGLLWLIVQPVCSQRYRACRAVRYNLTHNTSPSPSARRFLTVQLPPLCHSPVSFPTVSPWHVSPWHMSSNSVIGQTTKEGLLSLQGLTQGRGLPAVPPPTKFEPKTHRCRLDEIKFLGDFCKHISGILLLISYCKCFGHAFTLPLSWPTGHILYVPLTDNLLKSTGILIPHVFSLLPSTVNYLYSFKPVTMHFPAQ